MIKIIKKILILLSTFGLIDSIYLSLPYFSKTQLFCSIENISSCDLVTTSNYSEIFGIPNAFLGVLFYLTLLISFIFWEKFKVKIKYFSKIIYLIIFSAALYYIYLIYVQKFILGKYCPYCLFSATITFAIYIILIKVYKIENKK